MILCLIIYTYIHIIIFVCHMNIILLLILKRQVVQSVSTYKHELPYILESNLHPFYSFRGLINQMRIRFTVEIWILEK